MSTRGMRRLSSEPFALVLELLAARSWTMTMPFLNGTNPEHTGYRAAGRTAGSPERKGPLGPHAEVPVGPLGSHPAPRGSLEEAELEQVGLVYVLDGVGLLADGGRQRRQPDGAARELLDHGVQDREVELVQALLVHLEDLEPPPRHLGGDGAVVAHLREVPDPAQQAVRHAGRPAGAPGDLRRALGVHLDAQDAGGAPHDPREILHRVVVQPRGEPESLP